jgi:hypothetical protein
LLVSSQSVERESSGIQSKVGFVGLGVLLCIFQFAVHEQL